MITYITIPEQRKTVAILKNTRDDAAHKVDKLLAKAGLFDDMLIFGSRLEMPNQYRAVVVCADGDEYSVEEGKRQAKRKLLDKYYADLDERMEIACTMFDTALGGLYEDMCRTAKRRRLKE